MLRAVFDSSVLVSAFLTPDGVCADLLRAADQGVFSLWLSREIIAEVTGKLLGKPKLQVRYGYGRARVERLRDRLTATAQIVADLPALRGAVPLDPKDDMVVATAVAAGADHLVTGDRRHLLVLGAYQGIRIVTPRQFLDLLPP